MRVLGAALILVCSGATARADESSIMLRDGPGKDLVVAHCSACHSLDYIEMNSPFPDRKLWEAEINKMIKVFGARIEPDATPTILDYLVKHYGRP